MLVAILIYMKIQKTSLMAKNDFWCCLGAVCIMDHEVVPCSSKISDWPLNSSQDHLSFHQQKNVRVTMELEVPKRTIFRPTLSTDIVQWVLQ